MREDDDARARTVTVAIAAAPALLADALARVVRRPNVEVSIVGDPAGKDIPAEPVDLLVAANMRPPAMPAGLIVIIDDPNQRTQGRPRTVRHTVAHGPAAGAAVIVLQPDELKQLNGIIDSLSGPTPSPSAGQ